MGEKNVGAGYPGGAGWLLNPFGDKPEEAASLDRSLRRFLIYPFAGLTAAYQYAVYGPEVAVISAIAAVVLIYPMAAFVRYDAYCSGGNGWNDGDLRGDEA